MLCDVISAVIEFMVRMLWLLRAIEFHAFASLEALPCV
jgi:hypothetical protein